MALRKIITLFIVALAVLMGCASGTSRQSGLERYAAIKTPGLWESPDVDWVNWVVINVQYNTIYDEYRTDEQRLKFINDFDPDLVDWQCGRAMNRGDLCRMRGIAASSGMEPGTDSVLAGLEAFEDDFFDNGYGRDENGAIVKDGYGCVSFTQLAPKWQEITTQGMIRPTIYGDSHGRDNLLFGISYPGTQFDDWSNRLFVEYMVENFTALELKKLGFKAENFNIRDYLAEKRKTMNNEQIIEDPLFHEYIRFYYIKVLEIDIKFAERVKRVVAEHGRAVPAFYGNTASQQNFRVIGIPISALVDLAWVGKGLLQKDLRCYKFRPFKCPGGKITL